MFAFDALAQAECHPIQRNTGRLSRGVSDKELLKTRHRGAGQFTDFVGAHRNISPAKNPQALVGSDAFNMFLLASSGGEVSV